MLLHDWARMYWRRRKLRLPEMKKAARRALMGWKDHCRPCHHAPIDCQPAPIGEKSSLDAMRFQIDRTTMVKDEDAAEQWAVDECSFISCCWWRGRSLIMWQQQQKTIIFLCRIQYVYGSKNHIFDWRWSYGRPWSHSSRDILCR